jgi:hypothetical protein
VYRFTLTKPACVTVGAMRARADHITDEPHRPPPIMCMLLIAALAVIWNLLGHMKEAAN